MTVGLDHLKRAYIEVGKEFGQLDNQDEPQHEETGPVTRYGRGGGGAVAVRLHGTWHICI